jgi:hypothetical protein
MTRLVQLSESIGKHEHCLLLTTDELAVITSILGFTSANSAASPIYDEIVDTEYVADKELSKKYRIETQQGEEITCVNLVANDG